MAYIPGQASLPQPQPKQVQPEVSNQSFIAPDLQELVDKASTTPVEKEVVPASEEDWKWLKDECRRLLKASDNFDIGLSFEQRGQLYKYRQELRDLPDKVGRYWTPSSIVWPVRPNV